jgi:hypothetical protein
MKYYCHTIKIYEHCYALKVQINTLNEGQRKWRQHTLPSPGGQSPKRSTHAGKLSSNHSTEMTAVYEAAKLLNKTLAPPAKVITLTDCNP